MITIKKFCAVLLIITLSLTIWLCCGKGIDNATQKYAVYLLKSNAVEKLYSTLSAELMLLDSSSIITKSKADDVTVLRINTEAVNAAVLKLTSKANTVLSSNEFCMVGIPIGSMTGIRLLSGLGPKIKIKSIPVGNAVGDVKSNMISAGINQVNHRITVTINACVALMYPFEDCVCDISVELLLCETIIIGSVPKVVVG